MIVTLRCGSNGRLSRSAIEVFGLTLNCSAARGGTIEAGLNSFG